LRHRLWVGGFDDAVDRVGAGFAVEDFRARPVVENAAGDGVEREALLR
jgi:hypothetical protein